MAKKTEDGKEYPAEAFLYVPDPDLPSTWKLRIWENPEKKVTRAQLGRAAAALGPGFRGQRVQLNPSERRAAISKLRALYKKLDVEKEDLPSILSSSIQREAQERLHSNAKKLSEYFRQSAALDGVKTSSPLKEYLEELTEDLTTLSEHYFSGFTAMQDGEVSFETLISAATQALEVYHRSIHTSGDGTVYSCPMGIRQIATFPDALVYEHEGRLFQVGYVVEGTAAILDMDHVEVTAEFTPVMGEGRMKVGKQQEGSDTPLGQTGPKVLIEEHPAGLLREAKVDRDEQVIHGTVLVSSESVNGPKGKRTYSEKALKQIAQMAEGLPAYANHVPKDQAWTARDVREIIGRHRGVRYESDRKRVISDLHVLDNQADWVFDLAEKMPDVVGNSLVSRGLVRMEGDIEVVDEILAVRSGDLVSDPGATRGLFEHREEWKQHAGEAGREGGSTMTEAKDQKALEDKIAELTAKLQKAEGDLTVAATKLTEATTSLTEAKAKLDAYAAAEAAREHAKKLDGVLAESDLVKKHGKNPQAISETFKAILLEAPEAKWVGLIADRAKILEEGGGGPAPKSAVKSGGNITSEEARERLRGALVG